MNTLLNKWLSILIFFITLTSYSQNLSWPIKESDDPTSFYKANCTFCEIHNGGSSFHQGIDIDATNSSSVSIRPVADGFVIYKGSTSLKIQHNLPNNVVRYTRILEFTPSSDLDIGSSVTAGETILGHIDVEEKHLHIELSYKENGIEFQINPLNNSSNWFLSLPTNHLDTYNPQINNVFITPLANEPNSNYSGYEIKETNGSITNHSNSSVKIHLENWNPTSTDPVYNAQTNKLIVYGTMGFIANARDKGINTVPGPGTSSDNGLTVRKIEYFVDYNETSPPIWGNFPKYQLDFDKLNNDHKNRIDWIFNTNNTQLSPLTQIYGNDDHIKMFSTHSDYIWPQRAINGIQSNGKWYTKVKSTSNHLVKNAPVFSELASINSDAKYSDGIHSIRFRAFDAAGHEVEHTVELIIDNFRPYVSRVKIYEGTSTLAVYNRGWNWANNKLLFEPQPVSRTVNFNQNARIEIIMSEPMNSVRLKVNDFDETQNCGADLNKIHWEFNVPNSQLVVGNNEIKINGVDHAGNGLQADPSIIPIRLSSGWSTSPCNQGISCPSDEYHSFIYGITFVDFKAEQIGININTIQFTDKSFLPTSYTWDFGDNSGSSNLLNPTYKYNNLGVYFVKHDIQANGIDYSITKPVTVVPLVNGQPDFGYDVVNSGGKSSSVYVNFYSDCKGIIDTYTWEKVGGEVFSHDKNPVNVALDEGNHYNIKLTTHNWNGDESIIKDVCIDLDSYPYGSIHDWEVTYFLHDLEICTDNFDENKPFDFSIDYGDGTSDEITNYNLPYYTFTHQYFTTGEFIVFARVKGTDNTGHDVTLNFGKRILVSQADLEVNITSAATNASVYPLEKVTFNASVSGAQCQDGYHGSWAIYKTGDPHFYYSENISSLGGQEIDPLNYTFPSIGSYRIVIDLTESGAASGFGHSEYIIHILDAPKFIDCAYDGASIISLNSDYTFIGNTFTVGEPGVPEENWFPTNVRWTLMRADGTNKQVIKEEQFPYTNSVYSRFVEYHFSEEGTFILRMEAWNNTHDYEQNGQLDPQYANTIPYYDYYEKTITVSSSIASLSITEPINTFYEINAPAQTLTIKITNTSTSQISWTAEQNPGCGLASWFTINNTSGNGLCCGNEHSISVSIEFNSSEESRFGCVKIIGKYPNGEEVQGSPAELQIYQNGTDGPWLYQAKGSWPDQNFGQSVAIDGKYSVIGSPDNHQHVGNSYIYKKNDSYGIWDRIAKLLSSDNNIHFGNYVDISGDYVVVAGGNNVYLYCKGSSEWGGEINESKELTVNGVKSISLWGDYLVVGTPFYSSDKGMVSIFFRNEGGTNNWGLAKVLYGSSNGDLFGTSVDLYNDCLAVGAPHGGSQNQGYISVFNRNQNASNDWALEQTIEAPEYDDGESGQSNFGQAVAIFENTVSTCYYRWTEPSAYLTYGARLFGISYRRNSSGSWGELGRNKNVGDPINPTGNNSVAGTMFKGHYDYMLDGLRSAFGVPEAKYTLWNDDYGSFGATCLIFSGVISGYQNYGVGFMNLAGGSPYTPLHDEKYGSSVSYSYVANVIGVPGYNDETSGVNVGQAIFDRNDFMGNNLCEAGIDLTLINFTKPSGIYSDVIAKTISLGGRAFPATIEDGAEITYRAKEILLQDGFLADAGCNFIAESQDCTSALQGNPSKNNNNNFDLEKWPLTEETRLFLIKAYRRALPDLPWQSIDISSEVNFVKPIHKNTVTSNVDRNSDDGVNGIRNRTINSVQIPALIFTDSKTKQTKACFNINNR